MRFPVGYPHRPLYDGFECANARQIHSDYSCSSIINLGDDIQAMFLYLEEGDMVKFVRQLLEEGLD